MPNQYKTEILKQLADRYGPLRKLGNSLSLFEIGEGVVRIYVRYSKVHSRNRTWYGLRHEDLRKLEGQPSVICFIWDDQDEPLLIPFSEYEDIFYSNPPFGDGQYKAQIILGDDGTELYVARAGRFNVEGNCEWNELDSLVGVSRQGIPELTHSQAQTLLGGIGAKKGYDIWIPLNDRARLDSSLAGGLMCCDVLPHGFGEVINILQEVDVIWIQRGSGIIRSLFEVEHSTPIYSGLLRFNDIHLVTPSMRPTFNIVANEDRRALFSRQLERPTFKVSGL
ncbi:MAG: hypothetical protein L0Z70_11305, partial [Chloroflexi bacterium]|nr:hypothetical protein [Chloroflexota bacterium]